MPRPAAASSAFHAFQSVAAPIGRPSGCAKTKVELVPGRTSCQPLSGLQTPVTLQSIEQRRRQDERPNARPALGLDEDEAVPLLPLQGAPDSKRADDQVDVLPAKSERLALAQAEG